MKNLIILMPVKVVLFAALSILLPSCSEKSEPTESEELEQAVPQETPVSESVLEAATDVEPSTTYGEVISRLDRDCTALLYFDTLSAARKLQEALTTWKSSFGDNLSPEVKRSLDATLDFLRRAGLYEIQALGFSQAKLTNGNHRHKTLVLKTPGSAGTFWRVFGDSPHNLETLQIEGARSNGASG